jgi:SPP1 family predicted phage head-tail adaptor
MSKRQKINLITVTTVQDALCQVVHNETSKTVRCEVNSISMSEYMAASQIGKYAEYQVIMWANEYDGQEYVDVNGSRYHVYRTYDTQDRHIELYLEEMPAHVTAQS